MEKTFALSNSNEAAELLVFGDIGETGFGNTVTALDVAQRIAALPATVETIVVRINSYGGSVSDGLAIYAELRSHPARVVVVVESIAASIASLIAMAGDEVIIRPDALLMIHAPWIGSSSGNANDLRETAENLDRYAAAMAPAYARKAGWKESEATKLLSDGKDHWFTAEECVQLGLADRIEDGPALPISSAVAWNAFAGLSRFFKAAPEQVVAALRKLTKENAAMPSNSNDDAPSNGNAASNDTANAAIREEVMAAERGRRDRIKASCADLIDMPGVRDLRDVALDDPTVTPEAFGMRVLAALGRQATPSGGAGCSPEWMGGAGSGSNASDFVAAASDALLQRAGMKVAKPHPAARDVRGMSVVDMARACVSRSGRTILGSQSPSQILALAQSTSDFPALLGSSLEKALRVGMEGEAASHRLWAEVTEASNFRTQARVILGSAPDLETVPELSEYTNGPLAEDQQTLVPVKYGRIISLSYEAMLADNLGAFIGVARSMGQAAMRKESDILYAALIANALDGQNMADGNELFHTSRSNTVSVNTGTGKPLTAAALGAGRAKLRRQTNTGGGLLNLAPRFLIVPPEREHEAEILAAQASIHVNAANVEAATPQWLSSLVVIAEPRLADQDTVYLVAGADQIGTAEVAVVDNSPTVTENEEFIRDALSWKVRHAFAAGFIDYRGIARITITAA